MPPNVHAERFVNQAAVLPLVDLSVHHGGAGTMLGTAANGRPQLLMPQVADQFINGRAVESAGIGRMITNDSYRPGMIRDAVRALLPPSDAANRSRELAEVIAQMPSPNDVASTLLSLHAGPDSA